MSRKVDTPQASSGRSLPSLSWCIAVALLACLTIFVIAGEYRAQSVPPSQDILFDSLLQGPTSDSLTASQSPLTGVSPDRDADVCNIGSQRLGHELQALLWVMSAEKTALSPAGQAPAAAANTNLTVAPAEQCPLPAPASIDPAWKHLIDRLVADGFDRAEVQSMYAGLGRKSYSPAYMAAKVRELYGVQGVGIKQGGTKGPVLPENYQQPLSDFTIGSCLAFMKKHSAVLKDIERKHGVPANYIIGLLLVETGLGTDLGSHSAFRALSSMAVTNTPQMLGSAGNSKQVKFVRAKSLAATLRDKSNWAYNEVKALIRYSKQNSLDICTIPGSIYGAVGICQFMPSNIAPFAKDGNKNGKVDVFCIVDAMYSVANYLEAHGWRGAKSEAAKHTVIKSYNKDNYYATSVLASSNQLTLAQKGKISHKRHALAGVVRPRASGVFLDPSLKNLKPVPESAKIQSLGSYSTMLP